METTAEQVGRRVLTPPRAQAWGRWLETGRRRGADTAPYRDRERLRWNRVGRRVLTPPFCCLGLAVPDTCPGTGDVRIAPPQMDPRPVRKRLPHAVPQWVSEGSFFFITINCEPRGQNHICRAGLGDTVLMAAAHYHEHLKWHCRLVLLMPDHLHAIIAFPREPGIKITVTDWKKYLARNHGVQWQRDFMDHRLRDHHQLQEKTHYILMNPVRHGLCERMEDWNWVYRPEDRPPPAW